MRPIKTHILLAIPVIALFCQTNIAATVDSIFFDPAVINGNSYTVTVHNNFAVIPAVDGIGFGLSVQPDEVTGFVIPTGWKLASIFSAKEPYPGAPIRTSIAYFTPLPGYELQRGNSLTFGFSIDALIYGDLSQYPLALHHTTYAFIASPTGRHNGSDSSYLGPNLLAAAVPLPSTIWLLGSGVIGIVGITKRKSAKSCG